MDEPFGALDAFTREMMNMELQRIWLDRKKTVLFITHSIPEAVFLSDRVAVMSARPGTLIDLIEVNFPRPRNLDTMESPAFIAVINRIRRLMQAQSGFY
jgi:NitT/TauT family transport system ATP-binding protein